MGAFDRIWQPIDPGTGSTIAWPAGWRVHHCAETGSTNTDLLASFARGEAGDRWVLATDHQTAGRGRLDRRWEAPAGTNLLVSLLFTEVPDPAVELTHRVGLAAVRAASCAGGAGAVSLKWPNDVLLGDRKLAGILAQRASGGPTSVAAEAVVVGMGMNVRWAPEGAARLGEGVAPARVLSELLAAFDALPARIGDHYRSALSTLGQAVHVELPGGGHLEGIAEDVDERGRLVLRDAEGTSHRLDVGDIVHARRAGRGG